MELVKPAIYLFIVIIAVAYLQSHLNNKNGVNLQHLVVTVRSDQTEAIDLARELQKGGYESEVYLNKAGVYVITLGRFYADDIKGIKEEAIKSGHAVVTSTGSDGDSFVIRVWPSESEEVFLIAYVTSTAEEAIELATPLRNDYPKTAVYLRRDGSYAVAIGKYPEPHAQLLIEKFSDSSYFTNGDDLTDQVFPIPDNESPHIGRTLEEDSLLAPFRRSVM